MSSDSEKPAAEAKPETKPTPPAAKPAAKPPPKPAAKKQEEKPIPAFEKGISDKIVEKFGDKVKVTFVKEDRVGINAPKENVHEVAEFVRDALNYDHVESVSGVDYPADNEIEVVYHIGSYSDTALARQVLELTTRAPRESNPIPGNDATKLPSLRDIFYSVEFHEREIFEMLGVYFEGHPDNRRLLLPEDWADLPPLRKDFAIKGR
ncbi:NADH-quinone oxidoreductase subunit C [Nitrosopumilus sp. S4]